MVNALLFGSIGVLAETSEIQRQAYNQSFGSMALIGIGTSPIIVRC